MDILPFNRSLVVSSGDHLLKNVLLSSPDIPILRHDYFNPVWDSSPLRMATGIYRQRQPVSSGIYRAFHLLQTV